jgi:hypothetical protein
MQVSGHRRSRFEIIDINDLKSRKTSQAISLRLVAFSGLKRSYPLPAAVPFYIPFNRR